MYQVVMGLMLLTLRAEGEDVRRYSHALLKSVPSGPDASQLVTGERKGKVDTHDTNCAKQQRREKSKESVVQGGKTNDCVGVCSWPATWYLGWLFAVCMLASSLIVVGWTSFLTNVRRGYGLIAMGVGVALCYLAYASIH